MDPEQIKPSKPVESQQSKPSEVRFTYEGKEISLGINEFNALFTDINRFNSRFSLGSMLAGLVINRFEEAGSEDSYDEETQRMTASGIGIIHRDALNKIGLKIESVSGKQSRIFTDSDNELGNGEIRINIDNSTRFLSFLQVLDPQLVQGSELGENLQSLSNILAQQIFDHYNLTSPSDEALQLFGSLEGVVNEYERLGIANVDKLKTYLIHSKKGDLREYLLVEKEGLLSEPGEYFGPADWQKDSSPEFLKARWQTALIVLEMARSNQKAQDLYHQLFDHLNKCLGIAINDLGVLQKEGYPEEYLAKLRPVLREIKESFG